MHTLAFDTLLRRHRADADDLVADEISSATTAVDNYKGVAGLKPKWKKQDSVSAIHPGKSPKSGTWYTHLDIAPSIHIRKRCNRRSLGLGDEAQLCLSSNPVSEHASKASRLLHTSARIFWPDCGKGNDDVNLEKLTKPRPTVAVMRWIA